MVKKNFSGILILMAISVFGIIIVQLLWMQKAISIKEEQFNQRVSEALDRAAHRIERNQNAYFISSMFSGFPQMQNPGQTNSSGYLSSSDSLVLEFKNFLNDNQGNVQVIDPTRNGKVEKHNENGLQTITYGFDTVIVTGNSTQRIKTYSSVTSSDKNGMPNTIQMHNEPEISSNEMKDQLATVMDQMLMEFNVRNLPADQRLGYSVIAPTLAFEMKSIGIPLSFEYAITDFKDKLYDKLSSKGFEPKKMKSAYKTQLFPNEIMSRSDQLMVYFPEKRNFIFHSLTLLFSGSLLFTLIILITFYYTLRTILNQKRVSEIKTDFINNMTHEFKTPIATISLAADSISNPVIISNPEKITRLTTIIKEENRRMNRQVESVLQMALIDKKDFNIHKVETHVHPLIETAVKNISIQVEQKTGQIITDLSAENDLVKVDETHFVNVIYNLLDNANKYSIDTPPEIKISTFQTEGFLVIAVSDKGIGMDKETQERAFEKFFRYSTGNVHTVKGFGLGLSYAKAIVIAFKGDISVKSQKGSGSSFEIKLPLLKR